MNAEPGHSTIDAWGITPPPRFSVRSAESPAGSAMLVLEGEFDMAAAEEVRTQLSALTGGGSGRIVLDLAAVTFMDSSTLRELLRAELALRAGGGGLVLAAPTPAVTRLLALTRATELLSVVDSPPQAFPDDAA